MTQVVPINIAKLLKDKGFDKKTSGRCYTPEDELQIRHMQYEYCFNTDAPKNTFWKQLISAPSIAEVVEWLYEKHQIWIKVSVEEWFEDDTEREFNWYITSGTYTQIDVGFKSPSESYFSAFEFILKELL